MHALPRFAPLALVVALAPTALAALPSAPLPAAGPPVVVTVRDQIPTGGAFDLEITPDGRIYAVVGSTGADGGEVTLYSSPDDGDSWLQVHRWADTDGNPATGYAEPRLEVTSGTWNKLMVVYRRTTTTGSHVWLSSRTEEPAGIWSELSILQTAGVNYARPDIETDDGTHADWNLFVTAEADDGNGTDIVVRYATSHGSSWNAPATLAGLGSSLLGHYRRPRLACGGTGYTHLVYDHVPLFGATTTRYQHTAGGPNGWSVTQAVIDSTIYSSVIASPASGLVEIFGWRSSSRQARLHQRTANGEASIYNVAWLNTGPIAATRVSGGEEYWCAMESPVGVSVAVFAGGVLFDPIVTHGHRLASGPAAEGVAEPPAIAANARFGGYPGLLRVSHHAEQPDTLWFTAGWRGTGTFPSLAAGSPQVFLSGAVTPLLLTELDGTSGDEIVWGDFQGDLQASNGDGTQVPGFPRAVGSLSLPGAGVASADLDGDGRNELVTGTADGQLVVVKPGGVPLPAFPRTLDPGFPVQASIGNLDGGSTPIVVARCGARLHAVRADGTSLPGFPRIVQSGSVSSAPAALGDVDADGSLDVVTWAGTTVYCFRADGTSMWSRDLGTSLQGPPALAQVDGDPGLEVAVMGANSRLWILEPTGAPRVGWPVTPSGTGAPAGIAFARTDANAAPVLALVHSDARFHLYRADGTIPPGWPRILPAPSASVTVAPVFDVVDGGDSLGYFAAARDLHAFSPPGSEHWGYPRSFSPRIVQNIATGDVDGDGLLEVVVGISGGLVVLDTRQPLVRTRPTQVWPMWGYGPRHDFCLGCGAGAVTAADLPGRRESGALSLASHNPWSSEIVFRVERTDAGPARVSLYDLMGREVARLHDGPLPENGARLRWDGRCTDGSSAAPGVYLARLTAGAESSTVRVVRIR